MKAKVSGQGHLRPPPAHEDVTTRQPHWYLLTVEEGAQIRPWCTGSQNGLVPDRWCKK